MKSTVFFIPRLSKSYRVESVFIMFNDIVRLKAVHSMVCNYDSRSAREGWLSNPHMPHCIASESTFGSKIVTETT